MPQHEKYVIEEIELSVPLFTPPNGGGGTELGKLTLYHEDRQTGYLLLKIEQGPTFGGPPPQITIDCSVGVKALLEAIDTIRRA